MDQYNPERVHTRVGYIQYIYKNEIYPEAFDNFVLPLAVYGRNGIITQANDTFRKLAGLRSDDIRNGAVNIFERLDDKNTVLTEAAHSAFDGKEKVCEGIGRAIRAKPESVEYLQLENYPNAIFFPIARDGGGISLAGVLLDENKTDETEELYL